MKIEFVPSNNTNGTKKISVNTKKIVPSKIEIGNAGNAFLNIANNINVKNNP